MNTPAITSAYNAFGEMKAKHPDALLLFHVGQRLVSFEADATAVAEICGVHCLTKPCKGCSASRRAYLEFANFDQQLPRLVRAGRRVAIINKQNA